MLPWLNSCIPADYSYLGGKPDQPAEWKSKKSEYITGHLGLMNTPRMDEEISPVHGGHRMGVKYMALK